MKISYNWVKDFLDVELPIEEVSELLTDLGLEVEGVQVVESIKGSLKGVVVGEVLTCIQHPNADRLKITTVDLGDGTPVQIVCGAPNVAVGQKVPVATVGTTLYDKDGNGFKIKKGKIRGEESFGMICAEDELGVGTDHDGIMVLSDDLEPGTLASDVFELSTDHVIEIGLTPNRADAMSHYGVARDLRAGLHMRGIETSLTLPSVSHFAVDQRSLIIDIEVENFKQVPRYAGVTITNMKVGPSPQWLKDRLVAVGVNPINNVVDVTNYILHELGQPLHAFDTYKIAGNQVRVKNLPSGTPFVTLDGVERTLHEEDIMICDADSNPMCIAGIYGGLDSGVVDRTTSIFLESAYFDPVSIRKTAKRFGLNTDASFRFERGIDPNMVIFALQRAALLIVELTGGQISSDIVDEYPVKIEDHLLKFSYENAFRLIGEELSKDTIRNILMNLEIKITGQTDTGLGLQVPAYRVDVTREADVVEEILRVYGYNNINTSTKLSSSITYTKGVDETKLENLIATQLTSQGFTEMMANSLTNPQYSKITNETRGEVAILNPLSSELSVMRQGLLSSALEAIAYNCNRKNNDLQLFEFGKTYFKTAESSYLEEKHLSISVTGNRQKMQWRKKSEPSDFFFLKGIVETVLTRLGIIKIKMTPATVTYFAEGASFSLGKIELVSFGRVKASVAKEFGIKQEVLFADFNLDQLYKMVSKKNFNVTPLPKFPEVKRDLALLIDQEVSFEQLYNLAYKTERSLLKSVELFDVYEGDNLPQGKKSYALSFILQDPTKTLVDKDIDRVMGALQQQFSTVLNAELR
ncbi:phenylalanine--tRNA ligase subunit beta [Flavobacteriaceae bacterium F08102]|nr:phenylalanine--tRNA ligase subunit beta [Flavobacteriaceae bacterium F08102]